MFLRASAATSRSPGTPRPRPGPRVATLAPKIVPASQSSSQSRRKPLFGALLKLSEKTRFDVGLSGEFSVGILILLLGMRFRVDVGQWLFGPVLVQLA